MRVLVVTSRLQLWLLVRWWNAGTFPRMWTGPGPSVCLYERASVCSCVCACLCSFGVYACVCKCAGSGNSNSECVLAAGWKHMGVFTVQRWKYMKTVFPFSVLKLINIFPQEHRSRDVAYKSGPCTKALSEGPSPLPQLFIPASLWVLLTRGPCTPSSGADHL